MRGATDLFRRCLWIGCLVVGPAMAQSAGSLGERLAAAQHRGGYSAALLYSELGQHHLALSYADDVLAGDPTPQTRCLATVVQLDARFHLGALPSDEGPFGRAIEQCLSAGEDAAVLAIRVTLARKLAAESRTADAYELLSMQVSRIEASAQPRLIADAHALLADLAAAEGRPEEARQHARAVIAQGMDIPIPGPLATAHRVLYEIAAASGDHGTALVHFRLHAAAAKEQLDVVRALQVAYEVAAHENRLRAEQIELLEQQNRALALREQFDRQASRGTQLLVAVLLSLIACIAFWALHVTRRQHALRALAENDALTGTANRRHFLHLSARCVASSARTGEPVSLVLLGLDGFKQFNDGQGHAAGDRALVAVAAACRGAFRPGDVVGRLGEEEFAVLLPGCDRLEAGRLAEACRIGLDADLVACLGITDSTLSGHTVDGLLSDADQALHRARQDERHRVCVFNADAGWARPRSSSRTTGDLIALRT